MTERFGNERVVAISARIESEIAQLPVEEREAFVDELGLQQTGLSRLIAAGYRLLNLITFYTVVGNKLSAWQIRNGTTAPAAAGTIHSDMEAGFIRAETIDAGELLEAGSYDTLKETGRARTEGRDYVVRDGDVIHFLFKN